MSQKFPTSKPLPSAVSTFLMPDSCCIDKSPNSGSCQLSLPVNAAAAIITYIMHRQAPAPSRHPPAPPSARWHPSLQRLPAL